MTFTECRLAWRKDWMAMKAGTYVAPLPHPSRLTDAKKNPAGLERGSEPAGSGSMKGLYA